MGRLGRFGKTLIALSVAAAMSFSMVPAFSWQQLSNAVAWAGTGESASVGSNSESVYKVGDEGYSVISCTYKFASYNDSDKDFTATYYYSDGYFHIDPITYDEHLATMAMNMAMAGFGSNVEDGVTDEKKYRSGNVEKLLKDLCDKGAYSIDYQKPKVITEGEDWTIGSAIGKRTMRSSISEGKQATDDILIPVIVRGAGYAEEWAGNVTVGTEKEAAGFSRAAAKVTERVDEFLKTQGLLEGGKLKDPSKVHFLVVGYSRAGATANITSKNLTDEYAAQGAKVFGYDFEAPQGGYYTEAENKPYANIHNIINMVDLVPHVAPSSMGFVRYGVDHYVPGDATSGKITTYTQSAGNPKTGTQVTVTKQSDNSGWRVTKDSSSYAPQKTKMLAQLDKIDSTISFSDYFCRAEYYYTLSTTVRRWDKTTELEDWLPMFYNDLMRWAMTGDVTNSSNSDPTRSETSSTTKSLYGASNYQGGKNEYREYFSSKLYPVYASNESTELTEDGKLSFSGAVGKALGAVYSLNPEQKENLLTACSNLTSRLSMSTELGFYSYIIRNYDKCSEGDKKYYIDMLWTLFSGLTDDEKKQPAAKQPAYPAQYLSDEQLASFREAWYPLAYVLFEIVGRDYRYEYASGVTTNNFYDDSTQPQISWSNTSGTSAPHGDTDHIGTFLYNSTTILQGHVPEINLAWLRSYDDYYADVNLAMGEEGAQPAKVQLVSPEESWSRDREATQEESTSSIGADIEPLYTKPIKVKLSAGSGTKIYYTTDGSTPNPGDEDTNMYDANKGIDLPGKTGELKIYHVVAVAYHGDNASETSKFMFAVRASKEQQEKADEPDSSLRVSDLGIVIKALNSGKEAKGSAFAPLKARSLKASKGSVTLKWSKVSGAKKYLIYGVKCGKKNAKLVATISGKSTSKTVKKVAGKKLKAKSSYKFVVVAVGAKSKVLNISKTVHVRTVGGSACDPKAVKITSPKNGSIKLAVGKTKTIKAKVVGEKGKKLKTHRKLSYASSKPSVATVTSAGKIKAVGKGKCTIYVYASNGRYKTVKVTVK